LVLGCFFLAACANGLPEEKSGSQGGAGFGGDASESSGGNRGGASSSAGTGGAGALGNVAKGGGGGSAGSASTAAKVRWKSEVLVDPDEAAEQHGLALDAEGNAWAVWNHVRDTFSHVGEVHARRYLAANDAWDDPVVLDEDPSAVSNLTVAGSPDGTVVAAWAKAGPLSTDPLTIRAARYAKEDGAWSSVEDLATIVPSTLAGIRVAVSPAGNAVVAWSKLFVQNMPDDEGRNTSYVHTQLMTSWFAGDWQPPAPAYDTLTKESYLTNETDNVTARLPPERVEFAFADDHHVNALVAMTDGVRALACEDGQWSDPVVVTESAGGPVQLARLSSGAVLAAFVAEGSLYSIRWDAGSSTFSEPELREKSIDSVGRPNLAAGPDSSPLEVALTWLTGDPANFGTIYTSVLPRDGAFTPPKEVHRTLTGFPRIGVTSSGRVVVGGGKSWLWATASADGTSWPASAESAVTEHLTAANMNDVRFGVSASGLVMFLWVDSGGGDKYLSHHLVAMVGN
jgi:hypothetical protein